MEAKQQRKRPLSSPLRRIPSVSSIEQRLNMVMQEAAELEVLLRTAREIERVGHRAELRESSHLRSIGNAH